MLVLIVLFAITSANSATFVLGMFTGKGVLTPSRWLRVIWGLVQVMVAGILLHAALHGDRMQRMLEDHEARQRDEQNPAPVAGGSDDTSYRHLQ